MAKLHKVNFLAPAKINLYLYVLYRRGDGYHEIASLMVPVSLFDFVSISRKDRGIEVLCNGNFVVPEASENIAFRAAEVFFDSYATATGVKIEIEKNIPVGSGLGGGSSDAAAVLKGMSLLFLGEIRAKDLMGLASNVGSDVPFFVFPSPSRVAGRGEKVTRVDFRKKFHILIVKPEVSMNTSVAYNSLGRTSKPVRFDSIEPDVVDSLDDLEGLFHNDFEDMVFKKYPEVKALRKRLLGLGACAAHLTGSGSSVFGLYERKEDAEKARRDFEYDEGVFVKLVNNF